MDKNERWVVDRFDAASTYGVDGLLVGERTTLLVGAFFMLRRVDDGPWHSVALRGQVQLTDIAGKGDLAVGAGYPRTAYVSNDGGATWRNRALKARYPIRRVVCVSERQVAVAGDHDTFVSSDAGATFQKIDTLSHLAVSKDRLLGFDQRGTYKKGLFCWDDRRAAWVPLGKMPEYPTSMVAVGDALLAISRRGVHRSTDDGGSWALVKKDETVIAIACSPGGRVAAVGTQGAVLTSGDGGLHWEVSRPVSSCLKAVTFSPSGELWAAGNDGVVVRSGAHAPMKTATIGVAEPPIAGAQGRRKGGRKPAKEAGTDGTEAKAGAEVRADPKAPAVTQVRPPSPVPSWREPEPAVPPVHQDTVTAAAFLDEGRFVTSDAQGRLLLTRLEAGGRWVTGEELFVAPGAKPIDALAASGELVFVASGGHVHLVDLRLPGKARKLSGAPETSHLVVRAGRLAAGGGGGIKTWTIQDASVTPLATITLGSGALAKSIKASTFLPSSGTLRDLDLSPDGSLVAAVLGDKWVEVHDAAGAGPRGAWRGASARLRFTPGGDRVYLATNRFNLRVVSVTKGGGKESIRTHREQRRVVSSPGVRCLAALSMENELDVYATSDDQSLLGWRPPEAKTLSGAARAPVRGRSERRNRSRFTSETVEQVTALAVSDGGRVVAGDIGGEVAILDGATLEVQRAGHPRSTLVQAALGAPLFGEPMVAAGDGDPGTALFSGADGRLYTVDVVTGAVQAGPSMDILGEMLLCGDVLVVATSEGWLGVDRSTGRTRWTASFPVDTAVRHRGVVYGIDSRSDDEAPYRLRRLDPVTGATGEIRLTVPRSHRSHRLSATLSATAHGLLCGLAKAGENGRGVLVDPDSGSVRVLPFDMPLHRPTEPLVTGSASVSPTGRYLLWCDDGACEIRDGDDPVLKLVASCSLQGVHAIQQAHPFVEHGRIVGIDGRTERVCVFDLDGKLLATMGGIGPLAIGRSRVFGAPSGRAFVSWCPGAVVRRWPLP